MAAADSVKLNSGQAWSLTTNWQNLWELCKLKYDNDGIPMFEKFARTLNLEAPSSNGGIVYWSRTSIGDNPAGELGAGDSILKQTGGRLVNENTYNIYVKGSIANQELYIERTQ